MPFPPRLLSVGEEVAVETRLHWSYLGAQAGVFVVLGAVLLGVGVSGLPLPAVIVVAVLTGIAVVALAIRLVRWVSTVYLVTNHRIVYWRGLPLPRGSELRLDLVADVVERQTGWERLLGVGKLEVHSRLDGHVRTFGYVPRPGQVRASVHRLLEAQPGEQSEYPAGAPALPTAGAAPLRTAAPEVHADHVAGAPSAPVAPGAGEPPLSIPEQILQLHELVRRGILSSSEFEQKKRDLLGRL